MQHAHHARADGQVTYRVAVSARVTFSDALLHCTYYVERYSLALHGIAWLKA